MQLGQRIRQIGDLDIGNHFQRAGGGFGEHARFGRAMANRGDDRAGIEGDSRTHQRADVVRIGHLVENQDQRAVLQRFQPAHGQGTGFQHDALVYGLRAEDAFDLMRRDDIDGNAERFGLDLQPRQSVLCDAEAHVLALRIGQCCAHGMQAIQEDLVGLERRRLPVLLAGALAAVGSGNLATLSAGIAMSTPQSGVMRVAGGFIVVFVLGHGALYRGENRPARDNRMDARKDATGGRRWFFDRSPEKSSFPQPL